MEKILITGNRKSGKSLVTSMIARQLPKDKKMLIIDLNHENRELEIAMQVEDFVVFDVLDYLSGMTDFNQSVLEVNDNIDIMPSAYREDKYIAENKDYDKLNKEISDREYDYILIESNLDKLKNLTEMVDTLIYIDNGSANYNLSMFDEIKGDKFYIFNEIEREKISSFERKDIDEKNFKFIGKILYNEKYEREMDKGNFIINENLKEIFSNFINKREVAEEKSGFFNWLLGIFKK